jgi:3-isopropylmalate/(R)-2-methylmalate dehydratase small subunit
MEAVTSITSGTLVLDQNDIDTDQIIPARFLTTTTIDGIGQNLFADWRYAPDGSPNPQFALNAPDATDNQILVAGNNFGCGSSREHAPWALLDFGFRAIVSTAIADIFRNNSLKNGLVPVIVDAETHAWLIANPGAQITVDVENTKLDLPDGRQVKFPLDAFSRFCLLKGVDQLGYLLDQNAAITEFENNRAWKP